MTNAIGYVRCSTQEQADSGLGLDDQEQRIKAYCTLKGLRLGEIVRDEGVSGGKPLASRPGGRAVLAAVKRRDADAVIVLKLDRMFRNAGDCLNVAESWERAGAGLHILDLGGNAIDTTSAAGRFMLVVLAGAAGRFMLVVLAGAAEMERNLIRERTRSALAVKRANGQRIGTVPYGFNLAPDGKGLVPNVTEQAVIADIRSMRHVTGWTLEAIAEELNERGVPTKRGGSVWTHPVVRRILRRS